MPMTLRIAVYGKGGIGKSTMSSNLSRVLSSMGMRVLHIGCDPKHDSCRPLLHRNVTCTASDYIRDNLPSKRSLEDILCEDGHGVTCLEAGGPEPGVGCAGKGILTMFSTLERLGMDYRRYDVVIYDVLGDVVCGGFGIPMRDRYSDMTLIVTSGEYMSLYASNNILRGMMNFESVRVRPVSLVLNRRGVPDEDGIVSEFADATGVPVLSCFDRSTSFRDAENARTTVCDLFPYSPEAETFLRLAHDILVLADKPTRRPTPLTDDQLERLFSTGRVEGRGGYTPPVRLTSASAPTIPVYQPRRHTGKGAVSAMREAGKVGDIAAVVHGTPSCGFSMLCEISERERIAGGGPCSISEIVCTDMGPMDAVNGGNDRLRGVLERLACEGRRCIVIVVTCLPHMIGDDLAPVLDGFRIRHPDVHVIVANGGGPDVGNDAHMEILLGLADLVDVSVEPDPDEITIVDDTFLGIDSGDNLNRLADLASQMGLRLRPGFLQFCQLDDIISLRRAGIAVLGNLGRDTLKLKNVLSSKGMRFMNLPLPRGIHETVPWVEELGRITGRGDMSGKAVTDMERMYSRTLSDTKKALSDRRIAVITENPRDDLWAVRTLADAGADVTMHVMGRVPGISDAHGIGHPDRQDLLKWLDENPQDIVLSRRDIVHGYRGLRLDVPRDTMTHEASIDLLRWLSNISGSGCRRGWTSWGVAHAD